MIYQIVGIVYINSHIVYGMTKKGVPLYTFKPSDDKYPTFLVPTSLKKSLVCNKQPITNQYVIVVYDSEQKLLNKYPRANIIQVLGPVGESRAEYLNIIYRWDLYRKNYKIVYTVSY